MTASSPGIPQLHARRQLIKRFNHLHRAGTFNPWYFDRLDTFADLCDCKGLALFHQSYFRPDILEAGTYWADFLWRPANCLQDTRFPEPPLYSGGKRVFMTEVFYDIDHPVRRALHREYIRYCLESSDLPEGVRVPDVAIPRTIGLALATPGPISPILRPARTDG